MRRDNQRSGKDRGSSNFGGGFRSNYGGGGSGGGSRGFNSGPREMHKAICSDCGNECEVPFKPTEGKPVYCKACYSKHRPQRF